jgi:2-iminobutanoate/2-iminopropanoate deaminase
MQTISTHTAPTPIGHYSQAVIHQKTIYTAMQIPINPKNPDQKPPSIEKQTKQLLKNIENIIKAAGSDKNQILRVTIYLTDMTLLEKINKVYENYFGKHKPARGIVHVQSLPKSYAIAMDVIAGVK